MQEALTRLREDWARRGLPEFRVRIGINSGQCLAGNVGSRSRLKFTLLGDEINLAARLESLCKQYGCYLVISESTFKEPDVADKFCCRVIDRVAVVGKSKATVVREVLARRHEATENQLLLERLSNRMMEELTSNEIDKCADTLREMDLLKPDDLAIKKVSARVARFQAAPNLEKWSSVEYLLEK